MKADLKDINEKMRAKGKAKREGMKVTPETVQSAKKVLKNAALLNHEVTGRAKIEKLVSKR